MTNQWSKEEIALTRLAWRMHDHHNERKLMAVSWLVSMATVAFIAWVLI